MDTIELVKKAKKDNKLAFSTLIKHYESDLYRVAIAITKDEDDALDCIQETIVQVYISIRNLKNNEYFKTWLIKILINKCNELIKKNKRILELKKADIQNLYEPEKQDLDIKESIDRLDDELKILLILYYYQDMSVKDISESLEIPKGTVKSRLSRARSKLREILIEEGEY
ncbi:MAG: sigma-70 family RNA polymerase sigma factor [Romboutsia sp.]|uniref:sigma-70 family RNA polymerase sigma factor n=1 Tax=Romboutsia sp. TaxID=1965302 RepID=UPI003F31A758